MWGWEIQQYYTEIIKTNTHTQTSTHTFTKTHTHWIEIENVNMISCRKNQKNVAEDNAY